MKALLSVSFGTSYEQTRKKTIDVIDECLARAFPDRAFYAAWTSPRIVAKVRAERDEHHDTIEEAFARMTADGVDDVVVAVSCLMDGLEMHKIRAAVEAWEGEGVAEGAAADGTGRAGAPAGRVARVAEPLLARPEDRAALAQAICEEYADVPADDALLLMGHGSPKASSNKVYDQIQEQLHALGRPRFFVATVEGTPTLADGIEALHACGAQRVRVAPLMIVAGDHAKNDLAGDDEDSWKNVLAAQGFDVEVTLRGLGEYAAVRDIVVAHAHAAQ